MATIQTYADQYAKTMTDISRTFDLVQWQSGLSPSILPFRYDAFRKTEEEPNSCMNNILHPPILKN